MKHFIDIHRLKTIGILTLCHFGLAGALAAEAPPAKAPVRAHTVVGYNQNIKQADFIGLSKPTVLLMQNQLKSIYSKLPDWQADYAMKEQPLSDGIVGPVTLRWLQRYGHTFQIATTSPGYALELPSHIERVAGFGGAYPLALGSLLSPAFADWAQQQPADARQKDSIVLQRAVTPELLQLFHRYSGGRAPVQRPPIAPAPDGYYTYELNKDDLALLQGKDHLMKLLATLKDQEFHSLEEMRVGLLQKLGGMRELQRLLWPVVKDAAHDYYGHLINKATLDKLSSDSAFGEEALSDLRDLGNVYLKSPVIFEKFINDKLADGSLKLTPEETTKLAEITTVFDNVHLDAAALATIQNQLKDNVLVSGVPPAVTTMLKQLEDVNYPELSGFRSAAVSKIDFGLAMCKNNSPTNNVYVSRLRLEDADVDAMQKQLEALQPQAPDGVSYMKLDLKQTFQRIRDLRAKVEVCDEVTDKDSKELVRTLYMAYLSTAIESLAPKRMPDDLPEIRITGGQCGCALDDVTRISYAFYPYWKKNDEAQAINFRALNRIAFQGLTVDNFGSLQHGAESVDVAVNHGADNAFVRVAHRYNSKVDWVIQKNDWDGDWRNYTPQSRKVVFSKLRDNIIALLTTPADDFLSRLRGYSAMGLEPPPRRGDGVTLYFPNYPTDPAATAEFNAFYLDLRGQMDQHNLALNILVSQEVFTAGRNGGPGAFGLTNLVTLRAKRTATEPSRPGGPGNDEFLLILLNESSSDNKKALRALIEGESTLHGTERTDFLRSMLPVLHFDNRNWQQLEDDIVYSRDGFGGVGLWAPDFDNLAKPVTDPSLSCLKSMQLTACLQRDYREPGLNIEQAGVIETFSCVQRWSLRMILALLLIAIATVVVLFFRFCGAQNFLKKNFLWVLLLLNVPATLVFTMLLLYDPLLARLSSGNLPFIVMAALMLAALIGGYFYLRQRRRVPVRQRSKQTRREMGFPILVWRIEVDEAGLRWTLKNTGSGYAIIKRAEICYDKLPFADVNAALESALASDTEVRWKSMPLQGLRLEPDAEAQALRIPDLAAAREVEDKLKNGSLVVHIVYGGAGGEHWVSDGKEVRSISSL
ncbi:hypothetical protein GTP56_05975 [Duganella sp. FT134W]|uniref:Uncharacterized protein n=1 Tax=Duganella margarita TaxID=2692170 RepID=A0A7X4GY05_9BURK|nr:hypothetical protein [Duganella margarita]MYM71745.1 hypothetical protein [Duganella margarita]